MNPTHVWEVASALKQAVIDGFAASSINLPSRQFIADGTVARECDQFTIEMPQMFTGPSGGQQVTPAQFSRVIFTAEFQLEIIRCGAPVTGSGPQQAPSADAIEVVAKSMLTDLWVLWNSIVTAHETGTSELSRCDNIALGPGTLVGPDGGLSGCSLKVGVQL